MKEQMKLCQGTHLLKAVPNRSTRHKTLEERAEAYDDKLNLEGELDWRGDPVGNEVW